MADILPLRALVTGATSGIGRAVAVKLATDRRQCPCTVLSRRGVRAGDGSTREGQHHQHQQYGGPARPTRRCGLRGHQGCPGLLDARMDR